MPSPNPRAVLDLLRLDPAGKERPVHHYVFGDAIGQKVGSIKKAWEKSVLKAHGVTPTWTAKKGAGVRKPGGAPNDRSRLPPPAT